MADQEKLDRLCDQAEGALEEGNGDEALELAEEALAIAPKSARALLVKAEALFLIEAPEDAEEALEACVKAAGEDGRMIAQAANVLMDWSSDDHEAVDRALGLVRRAAKVKPTGDDPMLPSDLAWLEGRAFAMLDDLESSLASFERAVSLAGEAAEDDLLVELGLARLEMRKFDEARQVLERVARHTPDHPDAQHYLGLLAERAGNDAMARKLFERARELDPDAYPTPVHLTAEEFEQAVEAALAKVPEEVREALANVPIIVEPLPELDDLAGPPALSPLSLGMFRGPVGAGAVAAQVTNALPNEILLFQANLERYAGTREELVEQIEQTLLHEIGHFVGWDEDDLYDRGLH